MKGNLLLKKSIIYSEAIWYDVKACMLFDLDYYT